MMQLPDDFEARLRKMRLAPPPADLYSRRLARAGLLAEPFWSFRRWGFELALAATILLGLALGTILERPDRPPAAEGRTVERIQRALEAPWLGDEATAEYLAHQLAQSERLAEVEAAKLILPLGDSTSWM